MVLVRGTTVQIKLACKYNPPKYKKARIILVAAIIINNNTAVRIRLYGNYVGTRYVVRTGNTHA